MKTINAEKLFFKSRVFNIYQDISDETLKKKILCEYEILLRENDLSNKMLFKHQVYSIYPAISIYRTLKQGGYKKEQSVQMIRKAVLLTAYPTAKMFEIVGQSCNYTYTWILWMLNWKKTNW